MQAKILLLSGKKVSIPKLMELILKLDEETIIKQVLSELNHLDKVNWKRHEELMQDMGVEDSKDIDEVVYD